MVDLLKAITPVGWAALEDLNLPPHLVHAGHDAVVLDPVFPKFLNGLYTRLSTAERADA